MTSRLSLTLSIVCLMGSALPVAAQTQPREESNTDRRLRIDSPRDGAVVAPGDTLQIAVSSPARTRFVEIGVVMEDSMVERAVEAIQQAAHTGRIGDGKIFVFSIDEAIRIRTGERGPDAI